MSLIDHAPLSRSDMSQRVKAAVRNSQIPSILKLSLPITGICLANMAMSITDTAMAMGFGTEALAAVAVGADFYSIVFYLLTGLIAGIAPAYASASAGGRENDLRKLRTVGWVVSLFPAFAMFPLIWFAPIYLSEIGVNASILETGTGYMRAMAITLIPMCMLCFLRTRLTAIEKPGAILRVTLTSIPVNAGLNYLFMYGFLGWSGYGVTGAGIASIATACFMVLMLAAMACAHGDRGLALRIDWNMVRETIWIGLPISIMTLAEIGVYMGSTLFVAGFGPEATAAHALTLRFAGVAYALIAGLSQASTVRMARSLAEGGTHLRTETVRAAGFVALGTGMFLPTALILVALASSSTLPAMGLSQEATEIAFWLLIVLAATEIIEPMGCAAAGLLRGCKDTKVPMYFALLGNWAVGVPMGLILSMLFGMGVVGVWIGLLVGLSTAAVPTIARVRHHI